MFTIARQVYRDDYKPKQICSHCLVKLDDVCNFIATSRSANEKFEAMLYVCEDTQKKWRQSAQKNGVIVPSKGDGDGLGDCSDIMMMVQYKESNFLPLETLETLNEQDMLNVVEQSYVRKNQTVLRHSGDLREGFYNEQVQKNFYYPQESEAMPLFEGSTYDYNVTSESPKKKNNNKTLISVDEICKSVAVAPLEKTIKVKSAPNKIPTKLYACSTCDKKFRNKSSLNVHTVRHTNIRPYACQLCPKSFAVQWELNSHQRIHSGVYKCQFCSKTFITQSRLQRHERTHTNQRPFACTFNDCLKRFADKRNLTAHELAHSGVRDFVCDVCNKSYKTKCHLNDHKRAHEKASFKCDVCGALYKWKANLLMHMKKHEGYVCVCCKKDCGKLGALVKHRKLCESRKK